MTAGGSDGVRTSAADAIWPAEPRARGLARELYDTVAGLPLVSVHNGLPARYLAEDLPITDPVGLIISHDQGLQALLRSSGIRPEFTLTSGWRADRASRQAFVLLWHRLAEMWSRPWLELDEHGDATGLTRMRGEQDAEVVYDAVAAHLAERPIRPRQVIAAADVARLETSDDPSDDLRAHRVLADDPLLAGRVAPTFSPDRYLDAARRGWPTDAELLAEVTGIGTDDLEGFLAALAERRLFFRSRGATASEHHTSDVAVARLPTAEADGLFRLARTGDLLPLEARALQGHLLWESGRMSAEDGLVMRVFPPSGVATGRSERGSADGDRGVAERIRPLLADFGTPGPPAAADPAAGGGFALELYTVDSDAYVEEILPLAAGHQSLFAVPPTRFVDDPGRLRADRAAAVAAQGPARSLGRVDDMSGPFVLIPRHRLGRRLDAGALAELVVEGRWSEGAAYEELTAAVTRAS